MRDWLILWIMKFLKSLLGRKSVPQSGDEAVPEEEVVTNCPICGEEWEKGEIFCYHCGYEERDENLPLHPPPERRGELTDPDGILDENEAGRLREKFREIAGKKKIDIAILVLPKNIKESLQPTENNHAGYTLDGTAFALYNTWMIGKETSLRGMLIVIDPNGSDRVLVQGKNGPKISGSIFREWYEGCKPQEDESNRGVMIIAELDYLAGKLESLG